MDSDGIDRSDPDGIDKSDPDGTDKRPYTSPLREQSARRTRILIRDAAARLFLERGYVRTTVRHIADAAGVAVRTVFSAFPGGKVELFHEALAAAIESRSEIVSPVVESAAVSESDQVDRIVNEVVGYSSEVLERAGGLMLASIESSGADEDMRRFAEETARASAENASTLAEGLAEQELLRPEISVQRAADVLFTVVSPQIHSILRHHCGWSIDEYRNWVTETIRASLLR